MKKIIVLGGLLFISMSLFAQKKQIGKKVLKQAKVSNPIVLTDTAFATMGVKFGYPKNFKIFVPPNNPNYIRFYNSDSTINITIYNTFGLSVGEIVKDWDTTNLHPKPDKWYKNLAKTPVKKYKGNDLVDMYVSDYLYRNTFGGAKFILIQLITSRPGIGVAEWEAIKKSVKERPVPLVERAIVPGNFSMKIPAYIEPYPSLVSRSTLSAFRNEYSSIYVQKDLLDQKTILQSIQDHKKRYKSTFFKVLGDIHCVAKNGMELNGYYGYSRDEIYEAFVFFKNPHDSSQDSYILDYKLGDGVIPLDFNKEIYPFLETIKIL